MARQNGLLDDVVDNQWQVIQENANNALQVAKMKLHGKDRWTKEDYEFLFLVKKGIIKIPKGPIWDPTTHMLGGSNASNLSRGLFNVMRWLGPGIKGSKYQHAQDPFPDVEDVSIRGNEADDFLGAGITDTARRYDLAPKSSSKSGAAGQGPPWA